MVLVSKASTRILWASLVAQMLKICLQSRRPGFKPWVGKTLWRRAWQPTPVFLPGESHGQRSPSGYSPQGHKVRHDWGDLASSKHAQCLNGEPGQSELRACTFTCWAGLAPRMGRAGHLVSPSWASPGAYQRPWSSPGLGSWPQVGQATVGGIKTPFPPLIGCSDHPDPDN